MTDRGRLAVRRCGYAYQKGGVQVRSKQLGPRQTDRRWNDVS